MESAWPGADLSAEEKKRRAVVHFRELILLDSLRVVGLAAAGVVLLYGAIVESGGGLWPSWLIGALVGSVSFWLLLTVARQARHCPVCDERPGARYFLTPPRRCPVCNEQFFYRFG